MGVKNRNGGENHEKQNAHLAPIDSWVAAYDVQ
jgi:hypothetical protein